MAKYDPITGMMYGKLGELVFERRKNYNWVRVKAHQPNPQSYAQGKHRYQFGILQRLGSLWLNDYIKPYTPADLSTQTAYNYFMKKAWTQKEDNLNIAFTAQPYWLTDVITGINISPNPYGQKGLWGFDPVSVDKEKYPMVNVHAFAYDSNPENFNGLLTIKEDWDMATYFLWGQLSRNDTTSLCAYRFFMTDQNGAIISNFNQTVLAENVGEFLEPPSYLVKS